VAGRGAAISSQALTILSAITRRAVGPDPPADDVGQGESGAPIRPSRDFSQKPQKPIKLKASIAREPPRAVTREGPPRELLAEGPQVPSPTRAEPATAVPSLALEVQRAVAGAATAAGLSPEEWVARAARLLATPPAVGEAAVAYEEVVIYTLREMSQRLRELERRRGLGGWLRRVLRRGR
jgi:hypothetical protein